MSNRCTIVIKGNNEFQGEQRIFRKLIVRDLRGGNTWHARTVSDYPCGVRSGLGITQTSFFVVLRNAS